MLHGTLSEFVEIQLLPFFLNLDLHCNCNCTYRGTALNCTGYQYSIPVQIRSFCPSGLPDVDSARVLHSTVPDRCNHHHDARAAVFSENHNCGTATARTTTRTAACRCKQQERLQSPNERFVVRIQDNDPTPVVQIPDNHHSVRCAAPQPKVHDSCDSHHHRFACGADRCEGQFCQQQQQICFRNCLGCLL
jgi:hypothetical protein